MGLLFFRYYRPGFFAYWNFVWKNCGVKNLLSFMNSMGSRRSERRNAIERKWFFHSNRINFSFHVEIIFLPVFGSDLQIFDEKVCGIRKIFIFSRITNHTIRFTKVSRIYKRKISSTILITDITTKINNPYKTSRIYAIHKCTCSHPARYVDSQFGRKIPVNFPDEGPLKPLLARLDGHSSELEARKTGHPIPVWRLLTCKMSQTYRLQ